MAGAKNSTFDNPDETDTAYMVHITACDNNLSVLYLSRFYEKLVHNSSYGAAALL